MDVSIKSKNSIISGTLTPVRTDTCLLLIPGSGMQDRNETFGKCNGTFKDISDYFSNKGYSVFRYDKRGLNKRNVYINSTLDSFSNDVNSIVNFLSKKFKKIILLGHSEGGIVATKVASNKKVNGIIFLASICETAESSVEKQLKFIRNMFPTEVSLQMLRENKIWKNDIKKGLYKKFSDYYSKKSKLPEWIKENNKLNPQSPKYWNSHFKSDIRKEIKKLQIPLLILQGDMDFFIDVSKTQKMFKSISKNNSKSCQFIFKNLCHRFIKVKNMEEGFMVDTGKYWNKRLKFDKKVLNIMLKWVKSI